MSAKPEIVVADDASTSGHRPISSSPLEWPATKKPTTCIENKNENDDDEPLHHKQKDNNPSTPASLCCCVSLSRMTTTTAPLLGCYRSPLKCRDAMIALFLDSSGSSCWSVLLQGYGSIATIVALLTLLAVGLIVVLMLQSLVPRSLSTNSSHKRNSATAMKKKKKKRNHASSSRRPRIRQQPYCWKLDPVSAVSSQSSVISSHGGMETLGPSIAAVSSPTEEKVAVLMERPESTELVNQGQGNDQELLDSGCIETNSMEDTTFGTNRDELSTTKETTVPPPQKEGRRRSKNKHSCTATVDTDEVSSCSTSVVSSAPTAISTSEQSGMTSKSDDTPKEGKQVSKRRIKSKRAKKRKGVHKTMPDSSPQHSNVTTTVEAPKLNNRWQEPHRDESTAVGSNNNNSFGRNNRLYSQRHSKNHGRNGNTPSNRKNHSWRSSPHRTKRVSDSPSYSAPSPQSTTTNNNAIQQQQQQQQQHSTTPTTNNNRFHSSLSLDQLDTSREKSDMANCLYQAGLVDTVVLSLLSSVDNVDTLKTLSNSQFHQLGVSPEEQARIRWLLDLRKQSRTGQQQQQHSTLRSSTAALPPPPGLSLESVIHNNNNDANNNTTTTMSPTDGTTIVHSPAVVQTPSPYNPFATSFYPTDNPFAVQPQSSFRTVPIMTTTTTESFPSTMNTAQKDERRIEAELQELGGQMVGSILDY